MVRLQTAIFGIAPVATAAHRFTDKAYVQLTVEGDCTIVSVQAIKEADDAREIAGEIANSVLDDYLRVRLRAETEDVRRLILAQAFSRTSILRPDLDGPPPAVPTVGREPPPRA